MWKFVRAHPVSGTALYVGPFLTGLGFVMDGLHIIEEIPPQILEGVGAIIFFLAVIGVLQTWWEASNISKPATQPVGRTRSAHVPAKAASGGWDFVRTMIVVIALIGGFVGVVAMYALNQYQTYREAIERTRLEIFTLAFVPPGSPRLPNAANGLFVNIQTINRGDYLVVGMTHYSQFEYLANPLTQEEEDRIMSIVDAGTPEPQLNGSEIPPHQLQSWFSAEDPKLSTGEWDEIISKKKILYLHIEMKYYVKSQVRVTEACFLVTIDFPSVHLCNRHNRTFTR